MAQSRLDNYDGYQSEIMIIRFIFYRDFMKVGFSILGRDYPDVVY